MLNLRFVGITWVVVILVYHISSGFSLFLNACKISFCFLPPLQGVAFWAGLRAAKQGHRKMARVFFYAFSISHSLSVLALQVIQLILTFDFGETQVLIVNRQSRMGCFYALHIALGIVK